MWINPFELLLDIMRICEFNAGSWVLAIEDLLGERAINYDLFLGFDTFRLRLTKFMFVDFILGFYLPSDIAFFIALEWGFIDVYPTAYLSLCLLSYSLISSFISSKSLNCLSWKCTSPLSFSFSFYFSFSVLVESPL